MHIISTKCKDDMYTVSSQQRHLYLLEIHRERGRGESRSEVAGTEQENA